jgi:hypothetical protein
MSIAPLVLLEEELTLEQISDNQRLEKPEEAPCKIKASLLIIGFQPLKKGE